MTTEIRTTYTNLNAELNLYDANGKMQLHKDKEAARAYFLEEVNVNTRFFHDLEEKIEYLTENGYWDKETLDQYTFPFIKKAFKYAYGKKFRFKTLMGARKFYTSYALRSDDGKTILERYEDRIVITALFLAQGNKDLVLDLIEEIIEGRFQPATPTFQNSGKARRGELVSCFLLRASDSLDSIKDTWNYAAQLSKAGGGVAISMSDIREQGAPLKGKEGLAKGVVSWMKIYEDIFSTVDQLGTRQGAGAVYLSIHHPDVEKFLDSKRENADEKIRIKTLSTGLVIPDITFELAKENKDMYLFSPYDVKKEYGIDFSEIDITAKYHEMVDNPRINKKKVNARRLLANVAEIQGESGYPYLVFSDTVNAANPIDGKINMSNLCSEILQVNSPSEYDELTGEMTNVGQDISCNLGSMNVFKAMQSPDFEKTVETSIRALTAVSDMTDIHRVPTVKLANNRMHSIGLGQMSLATYFATHEMYYGDEESLDFTDMYFMAVRYYALKASNKIAMERKETFYNFEKSKYADGSALVAYTAGEELKPNTDKVAKLFQDSEIALPTQEDWKALDSSIQEHGLYHAYLNAVAPTGSISYVNNSSASIHPITSLIEIRKEGRLGRIYYPTPELTEENKKYFQDAYEVGPDKLIDIYAEATKHTDQGLSCTLFFPESVTTRDINKAQIRAWRKGLKTLYYIRLRSVQLAGTESDECVSCAL